LSHIGIDYTPAYEQGGGIGRYVRELVNALAASGSDHRYHLFVAGAADTDLSKPPGDTFTWHPTRLSTLWLARMWQRARLPLPVETFTGKLDIYHATDFVLPPTHKAARTLLTVHDLSFIRSPETASPQLRRYLSAVVPRSIAAADHILADSAATKADIIDIYRTSPDKITVLLSGVSSRFHPVTHTDALQHVRKKYALGNAAFIFSIGTVQPRKNYARLVNALAKLRARGHDLHLVIAGGKGWLEDGIYHAIEQHHMQPFVHLIGFADDEDIPAIYAAASVSAFVSLYEGFGLPVLESMACGTPVVTANVSSLPEVAGDAALMVDPTSVDEITDALQHVIENPETHVDLRQRGLARVPQFTWERAASQLLDVYAALLQ